MRRMSVAGSLATQSPGLQFFISATSRLLIVTAATAGLARLHDGRSALDRRELRGVELDTLLQEACQLRGSLRCALQYEKQGQHTSPVKSVVRWAGERIISRRGDARIPPRAHRCSRRSIAGRHWCPVSLRTPAPGSTTDRTAPPLRGPARHC